jgi:hypothetical protein
VRKTTNTVRAPEHDLSNLVLTDSISRTLLRDDLYIVERYQGIVSSDVPPTVAVAVAVFLRPLPYPRADRLIVVHDELSKIGVQLSGVSYETYQAYRNVPASKLDPLEALREE